MKNKNRDITVVIPSSPIRSHPSTKIIDETIKNIRAQLPNSEIILGLDGVRQEQEYLIDEYNEYKTKVLWKCLHEWDNVLPIVYERHKHQSGMMNDWIKNYINTPLLLYVEQDTPLTPDRTIDWQACKDFIYTGEANTIRFHFENTIPLEHEDLMIGNPDKKGFLKTYQWSQRPHLSSVLYYKDTVMPNFSTNSKTMIEDLFHGVVFNDYIQHQMVGWYKHRLWIYYPKDASKNGIARSYNLDGRGDEPKYSMVF